jgi:hypothetical protein
LAKEYNWLPFQSDNVEWADIQAFLVTIKKRSETEYKEKISEYMALINIYHSADPQNLFDTFKDILNGEVIDDEIGDIERLKALKSTRNGGGLNGDK